MDNGDFAFELVVLDSHGQPHVVLQGEPAAEEAAGPLAEPRTA